MVVESGDTPLEAIVARIEEGLLVESSLGPGQGNVISGASSNKLSLGFKIEGGEIVGRVRDVSVGGNIYQDLQRIEAVSLESEWVYGGFVRPTSSYRHCTWSPSTELSVREERQDEVTDCRLPPTRGSATALPDP
jgi:predicted Zn-dependent protease